MTLREVEIGGYIFDHTPSYEGLTAGISHCDGWDGVPDVRAATVARPGSHGELLTSAFLNGRALVLEGYIAVEDVGDLGGEIDAFAGVFRPGVALTLEVDPLGDGDGKEADVVVVGRVTVDVFDDTFTFSVPLLAPDPRKYAVTPVVEAYSFAGLSQSKSVAVGGADVSSHIVVTIPGGVEDPFVTVNGRTVSLDMDVPAGTVEFDFYRRDVTVAGVNVLSLVSVPDGWPSVSPGANTVVVGRGVADGTQIATATVRAAFL